jgi:hypothetical protein
MSMEAPVRFLRIAVWLFRVLRLLEMVCGDDFTADKERLMQDRCGIHFLLTHSEKGKKEGHRDDPDYNSFSGS